MTVCWHRFGNAMDTCPNFHHGELLFIYGRCRSGRRWFWAVACWDRHDDQELSGHGWADSENQALMDAQAAIEQLAAGRPAFAYVRHGLASDRLKRVNAERRRARPAPDTSDARRVEYLYGRSGCGYDGQCFCEELRGRARWDYHTVAYRITKKTAKRVYYIRDEHGYDGPEIGYVDRQKLEADGEASPRSRNWWAADSTLYIHRPEPWDEPIPGPADVSRLRREMADSHPDRGGNREAFEAARGRYLAAKAVVA